MDNVVISLVERAVKSIIGSSGHGPSSVAQNPDWRDFTSKTENTPLVSASSRLVLKVDQNRNDETGNDETSKMAAFRIAHAHRIFQTNTFFKKMEKISMRVFENLAAYANKSLTMNWN